MKNTDTFKRVLFTLGIAIYIATTILSFGLRELAPGSPEFLILLWQVKAGYMAFAGVLSIWAALSDYKFGWALQGLALVANLLAISGLPEVVRMAGVGVACIVSLVWLSKEYGGLSKFSGIQWGQFGCVVLLSVGFATTNPIALASACSLLLVVGAWEWIAHKIEPAAWFAGLNFAGTILGWLAVFG